MSNGSQRSTSCLPFGRAVGLPMSRPLALDSNRCGASVSARPLRVQVGQHRFRLAHGQAACPFSIIPQRCCPWFNKRMHRV